MKNKAYTAPEIGVVEYPELMGEGLVFSPINNGSIDGDNGEALAKPAEMDLEEEEEETTNVTLSMYKYKAW
ncbi:hypothetical protein [Prevotella sp. OH937_COT-195]|uniref:hypothetical protein n=1 Tax=Prevotella sp. OH937_COT-195 TaxID=2491051 RepID=UPI000F655BF9|nr:hypothetical protein [Prevotella sp. OH937_COT-195]RRD02666.1 hypothetical protein EII32_01220 [Prevotella sp. OH937_COT-195]